MLSLHMISLLKLQHCWILQNKKQAIGLGSADELCMRDYAIQDVRTHAECR